MYLRTDVFIATFGDRAVALDLNTSRYFALGRSLAAAVRAMADGAGSSGWIGRDDDLPSALAALAARGLVCDGASPRQTSPIVMPDSTLWPPRGVTATDATAPGLMSVMVALSEAQLYLVALPLGRVVRRLRAAKASVPTHSSRRALPACLAQFARSRPWYPAKPICRLDAIALCLYLWRNGLAAELVFGVRLDPFGAHCWAQYDGAALNDAHDFVGQFAPIMAV
jgi:hypothetical protein